MPDPSQFITDRTRPGLWTITFSNPPINMFSLATIAELAALMTDLEADLSVKVVVFQSANPEFFIAHLDLSNATELLPTGVDPFRWTGFDLGPKRPSVTSSSRS